ncbi:hypothetical protein K7X08_030380 [Anisodus acutangulus]|uniref:Uncharacterized protein n=1 Tax=Anisodus acutangulus TaxID=402998 RepID=A0A9Q1R5B1_9SOLA|nr:hypothetical protein K7X08_030380 [Anisodus acutangulus]
MLLFRGDQSVMVDYAALMRFLHVISNRYVKLRSNFHLTQWNYCKLSSTIHTRKDKDSHTKLVASQDEISAVVEPPPYGTSHTATPVSFRFKKSTVKLEFRVSGMVFSRHYSWYVRTYSGTLDAMMKIIHYEGFHGFYKGLGTKIVQSVLAAAVLFMVKEELVRGARWLLTGIAVNSIR